MCKDCVILQFPDRGSTCLDGGSYLLNFKGCAECGKRSLIKILERASEDDGDEEVVKYKHCCSECSHLIGEHEYKFEVVEQYQEFEMTCMLCGTASDSRSVMPEDPRKAALIF